MAGRLEGKVAIIVGGGQTPGETIGNGRATAVRFAREGARVLVVDQRLDAAEQTVAEIRAEGGDALAYAADATSEAESLAMVEAAKKEWGQLDVLHNNVGIGGGDAGPAHIDEATWDKIMAVNLKSVIFPTKAALPGFREQLGGVITNISSVAAVCSTGIVAYKTSKAGINAYTQAVAIGNAKYGIRANVIMPGLMNTPMAIEGISRARGIDRETLISQRDAQVPLRSKMGSAWDVANAALFLASDEAGFITGVCLAVDGGQSARIG